MEEFEIGGVRLGCPGAQLTAKIRAKLESGQYEGSEARAVSMRLRPGQRVLELGAGLGYIGALAAQVTGGAQVTSVEANPDMLETIRANFDRNDGAQITLRHGAVVGAEFEGETLSFARARQFWASRIADVTSRAGGLVEVPAVRIDALLDEVRPQMVIMDIEGAEQHLFTREWPRFVKTVVMELHPKQYESRAVMKQIVDCLSGSGMAYDPGASTGTLLCMRRV
ncbi:FkbM family methyltransferase [Rhodobacteraceae bacterium 63075]|nr:FkbM family methyltransferase [Rhodobacteraceae bacterium 63075]